MPVLPLQLARRRHPEWARHPVVVVDEDRPQGRILEVDERARRCGVRPGLRYAEGLSLAAGLCATVVDGAEIEAAVELIAGMLREFSPAVEAGAFSPGAFWLDASGFGRLHPSLETWARGVVARLREARFRAVVVVGFDRFGTYALARGGGREVIVLGSRDEERRRSARVRLGRLGLAPKLVAALERLGIDDVGGFRRLPAGGILERFGADGHRLHRLARGELRDPLVPRAELQPVRERFELDPDCSELDRTGLLFLIKQRLGRACRVLAERGEALAGLELRLVLDRGGVREERIRPAAPTLDEVQLVDLVRLRLESVALASAPCGFELEAEGVRAAREQLELFAESTRRDLRAANRALARLRAEFGDAAVVRAVPRAGHLPEACFEWRPLERLEPAVPREVAQPRLVRRILARPIAIAQQRRGGDGWLAGGLARGAVQRLFGPYVVSGGWWHEEQHREYYFAETKRGDILWVFYDRRRRRWFRHGAIE